MQPSRQKAAWISGNARGQPCYFSASRAEENLAYLLSHLDSNWIDQCLSRPSHNNHPILNEWTQADLASFLSVNTLAEDLRSVEGVRGLPDVLKDLYSVRRAKATRHVLHSAAMFARAGWGVDQFFPQISDRLPDYQLSKRGERVAVEAKLLERTDVEKAFTQYAEALMARLESAVLTLDRVHPITFIVLKNAHALPKLDDVLSIVKEGLRRFDGLRIHCRTTGFNVFMEPPQPGFEVYKNCQILCPRSDQENLRVQLRSRDASKQLKSEFTGNLPGLVHLGLNRHQDPHIIRDLLTSRFGRGQLSGIAGVTLSMSGMHLGLPVATPVEALASIRNPATLRPIPSELAVGVVGQRVVLFDAVARSESLSAYTHWSVTGRPVQPITDSLKMTAPIITKLVPDAFS